jgi:hypothetical protein
MGHDVPAMTNVEISLLLPMVPSCPGRFVVADAIGGSSENSKRDDYAISTQTS